MILFRFGYRQVQFDTLVGIFVGHGLQAECVDNSPIWASLGFGVDLVGK